MPKFTVYHMNWKRDEMRGYLDLYRRLSADPDQCKVHRLNPADYTAVADVECETLGDVFELTNTIDHLWWENPEVRVLDKTVAGFRSTSVTDVVLDEEGTLHLCAPVGWARAEWQRTH